MHHWEEHIQSSNKDLLKNINCNIGFIRIATEVEELIRPEGGKSNEFIMNILKEQTKTRLDEKLESIIKLYCH